MWFDFSWNLLQIFYQFHPIFLSQLVGQILSPNQITI